MMGVKLTLCPTPSGKLGNSYDQQGQKRVLWRKGGFINMTKFLLLTSFYYNASYSKVGVFFVYSWSNITIYVVL